jgi:hypothetical protein
MVFITNLTYEQVHDEWERQCKALRSTRAWTWSCEERVHTAALFAVPVGTVAALLGSRIVGGDWSLLRSAPRLFGVMAGLAVTAFLADRGTRFWCRRLRAQPGTREGDPILDRVGHPCHRNIWEPYRTEGRGAWPAEPRVFPDEIDFFRVRCFYWTVVQTDVGRTVRVITPHDMEREEMLRQLGRDGEFRVVEDQIWELRYEDHSDSSTRSYLTQLELLMEPEWEVWTRNRLINAGLPPPQAEVDRWV